MEKQRRVKIAYLSPDFIVKAFTKPIDCIIDECNNTYVPILKLDGVPEDAKVIYGWYDAPRNAFGIQIYHPSFPEVEQWEVPPEIKVTVSVIDVDFKGNVKSVSRREFL